LSRTDLPDWPLRIGVSTGVASHKRDRHPESAGRLGGWPDRLVHERSPAPPGSGCRCSFPVCCNRGPPVAWFLCLSHRLICMDLHPPCGCYSFSHYCSYGLSHLQGSIG